MRREVLRCVSCSLLAVLSVLLTDVCCEERGKIRDFGRNIYEVILRTSSHFDQKVIFSSILSAC